jgi:hypothetical protein
MATCARQSCNATNYYYYLFIINAFSDLLVIFRPLTVHVFLLVDKQCAAKLYGSYKCLVQVAP